ncbi:MAG: FHA domain-containing protein [Proteobacteria bacterium]|jgi:pSer/pThr/pTyr-binding forkhead associated (FHA) protein|nr:FHA domain-containing protein [Pseudomonadota bacterium]
MFKLVICDDEGKTTIVPLIRDEISVGRKEGNTIRLTDRNVSRQHARLTRSGDSSFLVMDLGSRNGTKVNGDPVVGDQAHKVVPGDQIYIGDYNLSIRTDVSAGVPMGRQMDPGDTAGIGKVTPHARLVMVAGPEAGAEYDLTVNLYVIGRSEEANLRIDDPSISRAHARLDGDEQAWTISDLDSINGILINGTRRDDYLLKSGDVIELGIVKLRFVAPGEPYEYVPLEAAAAPPPPQKAKSNRLFLILAGLGVLAAAAIVIAILLGRSSDEGVATTDAPGTAPMSFEELMEAGKDQMQDEAWAEAARLFAQAQQLKPDDAGLRELKNTAIAEMEAQAALVAALAAEQANNWREAVDNLAKIPRSSRYYDAEQVAKMSKALCEELVAKGAAIIQKGNDPAGAEKIIEEIGLIPEASDECRSDREALVSQLARSREPASGAVEPEVAPAGGSTFVKPSAPPKGYNPPKGKLPSNPYDNPYMSDDTPSKPSKPSAPAPAAAPPAAQPPAGPQPASPYGQADDGEAPPSKKGKSKMTWDTP